VAPTPSDVDPNRIVQALQNPALHAQQTSGENSDIDELKAKKAAAIENEDFDEAARLKHLLDAMQIQ